MKRIPSKPGFALMMTLMLVLLLGALLAGIAWKSATQALDARGAIEELQRRWAIASMQSTLLGRSETILSRAEEAAYKKTNQKTSVARYSIVLHLAGFEYQVLFTDEQSKLNVNTFRQTAGKSSANAYLSQFAKPASTSTLSQTTTVSSYEQIFDSFSPDPFASEIINTLTCWGSGSVNVRRASDLVLTQILGQTLRLSQINDLLAARQKDPFCELGVLLDPLDSIDESTKTKLRGSLTDSSHCHGLWIIAKNSQRSWTSLAITTSGPTPQPINPDARFFW